MEELLNMKQWLTVTDYLRMGGKLNKGDVLYTFSSKHYVETYIYISLEEGGMRVKEHDKLVGTGWTYVNKEICLLEKNIPESDTYSLDQVKSLFLKFMEDVIHGGDYDQGQSLNETKSVFYNWWNLRKFKK